VNEQREVRSVDVAPLANPLVGGWRVLAAAALIGAFAGLLATWVLPDQYESEINLRIGVASNLPVENSKQVASLLQSEGFRLQASQQLGFALRPNAVRAEAVESAENGASAYVRATVRAGSPENARAAATLIQNFLVERHAPRYAEAQTALEAYSKELAGSLSRLEANIEQMQASLAAPGMGTRDGATAALLLQSNLAQARTQYAQLRKDLKEHEMQRSLRTVPTAPLGPPGDAREPVWPSRPLFAAAGLTAGALLAAAILVLRT
jgi:uncharacterized protein involved in exopolysaccharide biosynthesis